MSPVKCILTPPAWLVALVIVLVGTGAALAQEKVAEESSQAFLGIVPRHLDHVMRSALDYEEPGVLLGQVIPDSPAEKAGLVVGDILVRLGGVPIHDPERLTSVMREHKPGDAVDLLLLHKGKSRTVKATLVARPAPRMMMFDKEHGLLEGLDRELQALSWDTEGGDKLRLEIQQELDTELEGLKDLQDGEGDDDNGGRRVRIIHRERENPVYD